MREKERRRGEKRGGVRKGRVLNFYGTPTHPSTDKSHMCSILHI